MKKNKLHKLLAILLVGAMAMGSLTACSSSSSSDDTTEEEEAVEEEEEEAAEEETAEEAVEEEEETAEEETVEEEEEAEEETSSGTGIASWTAFEETVTLEIPIYDRGVEGIADLNDNWYTNWLQETFGDVYNIDLEYIPITRTDVMTDYALLAASGDLPTILMEFDYDKVATWASEGYLQPYDLDYFAEIAPTYYAMMEASGNLTYTEILDDTYYVAADNTYWNSTYSYVTLYRLDWVQAVGYDSYPTTYEEEKEMLQAIKDAGLCDYPLGGSMTAGAGIDQTYAFREIPMDELDWVMYGDYQYPALSSEWTHDYLERQNEYYNLGFINPEYYTIDSETAKSYFVSGQTLTYGGYISSTMDWVTAFYENNPDGQLAVKIYGNEGEEGYRTSNPFGYLIGFAYDATEDEITAAMMYLEWMSQEDVLFTMQWGAEGETFEYDEDGNAVMISDYSGDYLQGYQNNKDYWNVVNSVKLTGDIEDTIYSSLPHDLPDDFTDQVIEYYYHQTEDLASEGYAITDCMFAGALESVSEYGTTLLSLYAEYRDQLVVADPDDFDALYEELGQKYLDAGYQAIIDERAEYYENGLTTTLPDYQKK